MTWWQRLWRRPQLERELDAELQDHLDRLAHDLMRAGLSESEARRRARLEFGGTDQIKERCRDVRGTGWIDDIGRDVRFSLRMLATERWFSVAAVGALALGIAGTSMIATIINGYHFKGLPVDGFERILALGTRDATGRTHGVSYADYQDWRAGSRSFVALGAFQTATMIISDRGQSPDSLDGAYVSSEVFSIAGGRPALGRGFLPAEERLGAPPTVVLGHRLWASRYAADATVIGRSVTVNGVPATVIGVMPEGFEFPYRHGLWQPLTLVEGIASQPRDARRLDVFGRLADNVTPAHAEGELAGIAAALAGAHPSTNAGIAPTMVRFGEQQVGRLGDTQPPLFLAATSTLVLLIACANVASLLLAGTAGRSRELAIRTAVGATRWRLVRQLLVESLLLACLAGVLGLWLSTFGVRFISEAFGRNVPYWMRFTVDGHVVAILVILCVVTSLLSGLAPALLVSKTDGNGLMHQVGRASVAPRVRRWTQALLVAEFALTVILLASAGLLVRSFLALYRGDRAIDASRVLTMELELPDGTYATPQQRADFYARLDDSLGVIAGIPLATVASTRPFVGAPSRQLSFGDGAAGQGSSAISVATIAIGPRYFDAIGVPLLRGRQLVPRDASPGNEGAIVNQRFAEVHLSTTEPLGQRIRLSDPRSAPTAAAWRTIVGVAPTIRQGIATAARPVVYVPLGSHSASSAAIIVGGLAEPAAATPVVRRAVAMLDPEVTVSNVRPLPELLSDSRLQHRLLGTVLGVFATVALTLSTVGVYGMAAYAVRQRRHEIGVRMALGARTSQVVWLFAQRALVPVALGTVIGLGGAVLIGRLLQGLLVDTRPTDPLTLVAVVTLLALVTVAACVFPSRRAARRTPMAVLKCE